MCEIKLKMRLEKNSLSPKFKVYIITNTRTGHVYIGLTSRKVIVRFYEHVIDAYKEKRTPLSAAIRRFTPAAFSVAVLDYANSKIKALSREIQWIRKFKSTNRRCGYNQNDGGSGMLGLHHDAAWRAAHSKRMTGQNHPSFGLHRSAETCKKISESKKGKKLATRRRFPMAVIQKAYTAGDSLRTIARRYETDKGVIGLRLRELGVVLRPPHRVKNRRKY
jgi:group I intron endonuclease